MGIKAKLLLSIAASLAISGVILCLVFAILRDIGNESARVQAYNAIEDKTDALNLMLARFPTQPDESSIRQIKSIRESLEELLGGLQSFDAREELLLRQIRMNAHELGNFLEKLISSFGQPEGGVKSWERRDVIVSQLWMKTQFISDDTQRLSEISQSIISSSQEQAGILILVLIVALILINAGLTFFFGRSTLRAQAELRESEQKFKTAFHASAVMKSINSFDEGRFLEVNETFEKISGYQREEVIGYTSQEIGLWTKPSQRRELAYLLMTQGHIRNREMRFRTKPGEFKTVMYSADKISLAGRQCILSSALDISERKRTENALQHLNRTLEQQVAERTALADARAKQLQALAVELLEAEEKERQRISLLLHDDLQQLLASANMQLQGASASLPRDSLLENVEKLLFEAIGKSRNLSQELSPPVLQLPGLIPSLRWLIQRMWDQFGLQVQLRSDDIDFYENTSLKAFAFRAVQELLFNIVKHSDVKKAHIDISGSDSRLVIRVSDQGKGFDPTILDSQSASTGLGLGLLSLRERASYIGGSFSIESAPGQGSRFVLELPLGADLEVPQGVPGDVRSQVEKKRKRTSAGKIRVLFADDHKIMRKGLLQMVSSQPDIEVVGEAANGVEACELARQLKPDVVVMDVSMPVMDGIKATRHVKAERPEVRVVGLSMHEDEHIATAMRAAGAECLVSKTASPAQLLKAIYGTADN
ncbi:MAG: response regulator [Desulfobacterales bacterium]|nr:response regulator [Desulfobacterales bacterium]